MSQISENNPISLYTKESKARDGEVLVVARGNEKSGTKTICASMLSITQDHIIDHIEELIPHIQDMLHAVRIKIVRANEQRGFLLETDADVSACIAAMEAESRLTKEDISNFLTSEQNKETLRAAFALKFKWHDEVMSEEQNKKLDQATNALIDVMSELAGSRTVWEEKKQNTVESYLDILMDSPMKSRLMSRLDAMTKKREAGSGDLLESLGF